MAASCTLPAPARETHVLWGERGIFHLGADLKDRNRRKSEINQFRLKEIAGDSMIKKSPKPSGFRPAQNSLKRNAKFVFVGQLAPFSNLNKIKSVSR